MGTLGLANIILWFTLIKVDYKNSDWVKRFKTVSITSDIEAVIYPAILILIRAKFIK